MKKINSNFNGGFPFVLDDLRWMDEGINEAMLAICRAMLAPGQTSMILSGCDFDLTVQDEITITAGWLYYNESGDERILRVDAQTLSDQGFNIGSSGDTLRWDTSVSYDAAGNKTFYDSSTHNTYEVHKAVLVHNDSAELPTFLGSIRETAWVSPSLTAGFTHVSGRTMYYRLRNGDIEFKGEINGGAGSVMTLPAWCTPGYTFRQLLTIFEKQSYVTCRKDVEVTSGGVVSIVTDEAGPDYTTANIPFNFKIAK